MKTTANIATYKGRANMIGKMLSSIYHQFDEIRIYANDFTPYDFDDPQGKITILYGIKDLADNGKFYFVADKPEYYFMLDDDLIYPPDYVSSMKEALRSHQGCIVTHHGRQLTESDIYYRGPHKEFRCMGQVEAPAWLDVCGTGVSAFDTRYVRPIGIHEDERLKMSDLILSEWAALNNVGIICMPHDYGWFKHLPISDSETIYGHFRNNPTTVQDQLQKTIYLLKNGNKGN